MKLFQVYENDLQKLEYALPRLQEALLPRLNDPELQVLFAECKEVISNIRWNYGPPSEVQVVVGWIPPQDG
jgi:hypothetical protein